MRGFITPPRGGYFVHGFRTWNALSTFHSWEPEMSCSIQLDGFTNPFRSFGIIISIEEDGIVNAFNRDVGSILRDGKKALGHHTVYKNYQSFTPKELDSLLSSTHFAGHNEIWVDSNSVHIVSAYSIANTNGIPGVKAFRKACHTYGYPIQIIPSVQATKEGASASSLPLVA